MRAADVATEVTVVSRSQSVAEASRALADSGKTGVVVTDGAGTPIGVITALDVLRLAIPEYLLDDPSLAATLDEQSIEEMTAPLRDKTVAEVIADRAVRLHELPTVAADATVLETAAVLVAAHSSVAVLGNASSERRFVTLSTVLQVVLDHARGDEPT